MVESDEELQVVSAGSVHLNAEQKSAALCIERRLTLRIVFREEPVPYIVFHALEFAERASRKS